LKKEKDTYEMKLKNFEHSKTKEYEAKAMEFERLEAERDFMEVTLKFESEMVAKNMDFERKIKELKEMEKEAKVHKRMKNMLRKELSKWNKMIEEANLMTQALSRNFHFQIELSNANNSQEEISIDSFYAEKIKIKLINNDLGTSAYWKIDKFETRLDILKDKVDHFFKTNQIVVDKLEDDPFWDPPQHIEAGIAIVMLKPICYLFDIDKSVSIYGCEEKVGSMRIEIFPCNPEGTKVDEDDFEDDLLDPMQLVNQRLDFTIIINDGELDPDFCKDSYVEYKLYINGEKKNYRTEIVKGKNAKPEWNYKAQHTIHSMNQVDISYLCETKLELCLYVLQEQYLQKKE